MATSNIYITGKSMKNILLNKNNIMLDLETLSTDNDSVIISIGAVKFNEKEILDRFYEVIDINSCLDLGMSVSDDTFMFWLKQPLEAKQDILSNRKIDIKTALKLFTKWCGYDPQVFGNGAAFDNVIISSAYKLCKLERPWRYSNNLCFRTLKRLYPDIEITFNGVKHKSVDDAEWQALYLIELFKQNVDSRKGVNDESVIPTHSFYCGKCGYQNKVILPNGFKNFKIYCVDCGSVINIKKNE